MNKTNFVTGVTGLVGSHLVFRLLSENEKVIAAIRKTSRKESVRRVFSYYTDEPDRLFDRIEWIECRLDDYESVKSALPGGSSVYHCAAMVSFAGADSTAVIDNNVKVTSNIVRVCLENEAKLCHVSSTAAIGAGSNEAMVDETHKWNDETSHSAYSISKHLSEEEVWHGISAGLKAVIVNPSVIIGPGEWNRSSSQFFPNIDRGMLFYTNGITGYVYVNDVVEAMIWLMRSSISGERYLVTAENLTYGEILRMIASALGVRKPFIYAPPLLAHAGLHLTQIISGITGRVSPLSKDTLNSAYSVVKFDNSKIVNATGLRFTPIETAVKSVAGIYNREKKEGRYKTTL
jgi:nucleoside-diphosphate-sugar epimerase